MDVITEGKRHGNVGGNSPLVTTSTFDGDRVASEANGSKELICRDSEESEDTEKAAVDLLHGVAALNGAGVASVGSTTASTAGTDFDFAYMRRMSIRYNEMTR